MGDSSFPVAWLELREPVDHRSRDPELVSKLRSRWGDEGRRRILDLGAGTGSNLRYLAPRLPGGQEWTLLDQDPELLSDVKEPSAIRSLRTVEGRLESEGLREVDGHDLVTASALLDLVSAQWLEALVGACVQAEAAVLLTLTYDGRIRWVREGGGIGPRGAWESERAGDRKVRDAVNRHQRRDKGMGPALGPEAAGVAERLFRDAGFSVTVKGSPWRLSREDGPLIGELVRGWMEAAAQEDPEGGPWLEPWGRRRLSRLEEREGVVLEVGHQDLLALPRKRG